MLDFSKMSQQELVMYRAKDHVSMANCFWGADASLYGADFANRNVEEAEAYQRKMAGKVIAGDFDHPVVSFH